MSLRELLRPLSETAGVMAVQVSTRDGLPVEMIGHGLRTDVLAAETAAVAESSRSAAERLMLGEPTYVSLALPQYRLLCFPLEGHVLAVVVGEGDAPAAVERALGVMPGLAAALANAA